VFAATSTRSRYHPVQAKKHPSSHVVKTSKEKEKSYEVELSLIVIIINLNLHNRHEIMLIKKGKLRKAAREKGSHVIVAIQMREGSSGTARKKGRH